MLNLDLNKLRLSQDFGAHVGVKKHLTRVPVTKPNKQAFIRTHPSEDMRLETAVIYFEEDRETYLVDPALWAELPEAIVPKVLITSITRHGDLFLWPIPLPGPDGRHNEWHRSALEAASMAQSSWIRVVANQNLRGYDVYQATADLPEPEWPDLSLHEILQVAFRDHYVDSSDHLVLRRLRGDT